MPQIGFQIIFFIITLRHTPSLLTISLQQHTSGRLRSLSEYSYISTRSRCPYTWNDNKIRIKDLEALNSSRKIPDSRKGLSPFLRPVSVVAALLSPLSSLFSSAAHCKLIHSGDLCWGNLLSVWEHACVCVCTRACVCVRKRLVHVCLRCAVATGQLIRSSLTASLAACRRRFKCELCVLVGDLLCFSLQSVWRGCWCERCDQQRARNTLGRFLPFWFED